MVWVSLEVLLELLGFLKIFSISSKGFDFEVLGVQSCQDGKIPSPLQSLRVHLPTLNQHWVDREASIIAIGVRACEEAILCLEEPVDGLLSAQRHIEGLEVILVHEDIYVFIIFCFVHISPPNIERSKFATEVEVSVVDLFVHAMASE